MLLEVELMDRVVVAPKLVEERVVLCLDVDCAVKLVVVFGPFNFVAISNELLNYTIS